MDAPSEAFYLLSKLESYDYANIDTLFSSFLHPFSLLISPNPQNPNPKPSKSKKQSPSSSIRSLVKIYLPFVNKSLLILPKRLFDSPKNPKTVEFLLQLLGAYRMCLDCLTVMSTELSGKPYGLCLQRARYVHCLLRWERYDEGFDEGVRVLNLLGRVDLDGFRFRVSISNVEFVPKLDECIDCDGGGGIGGDKDGDEFVRLVVDLVVVVAQCVSIGRSKDAGKYSGLLVLLREVRPWFSYMEASASSKLQWKLLGLMKNTTNFLIREAKHFDEDLVSGFCAATFNEYTQLLNAGSPRGRTREELEEFVQFLYSCVYKCRSACKKVQCAVSMHLYKSARNFFQGMVYISLVQRLYAIGLNLYDVGAAKGSIGTSFGFLPEGCDKLQDLSSILKSGKSYYHFDPGAVLPFYLNALKFLCGPLAQFVNSERKRIVKEEIEPSLGDALKLFQEAFAQYCYLVPLCQEKEAGREEIDMVVLSISMASFTLSLKLFHNTKKSKILLNHLLSDKCMLLLQPQMLNYLVCMLHNLFVEFYRHERLKEAAKAGKFCCRASWSRCILLCERAVGKLEISDEDISESMIADSANEACKDNSLLMDILHQREGGKVDNVILSGLEKWCYARSLVPVLLCPEALMKRWVKIQCKLYAKTNSNAPILGSLLLCSSYIKIQNLSPGIIGIILEQELLLYQELSSHYPGFCQRMQVAIIDILLQKVYLLNKCLQRSIVLAKKALLLRNLKIGSLESSVDCLSEAIESIDGLSGMTQDEATIVSNQLAILYCLRALGTQEATPSSKGVFTDISEAVRIWQKSDVPCHLSSSESGGCAYALQLMYHIADLLSIKGNVALHSDILYVILKVLKRMNVSLNKSLALLWESRRISHALCVIPINEAFILALSNLYGKEAESFEFWVNCMKDSRSLSVGLKQNFSFLSSFFPLAFHQHKNSLQLGISVDEAKQVASDLISNVSASSSSAFLAGHICYDLSERLSASGEMIEALLYAKAAQGVRSKMLQEHFSFKYGQHDLSHNEATQNSLDCVCHFTVLSQVAIRAWPNHTKSLENSDGFLLTPWNVLRSFLESSLQVGVLHETLGNVAEAEALFLAGKSISRLQNLPLFVIAFSSYLGKVYHGKGLLDLAHKELGTAQHDLKRIPYTCSRCSIVLESTLNEHVGNLFRKGVLTDMANPYESPLRSLISLEKGDLTVWFEEGDSEHPVLGSEFCTSTELNTEEDRPTQAIKNQRTKSRAMAKNSRKPTKELESQAAVKPCVVAVQNSRVTRSRKQPCQSNVAGLEEVVRGVTNSYSDRHTESEVTSVSNRVNCEKCLLGKLKSLGSLTSLIKLKWEYVRRRQILRLLIGLGKCEGSSFTTTLPDRIYSKCVAILHGGNDCHCLCSASSELEFIGYEIPGDSLALECAEVFYTFGWYISKALYFSDTRSVHHVLSSFKLSHVVSLLKHAYVLSREMPLLFQKVSKLLALMHLVSVSRASSLLSLEDVHSENHWAAYFHQAAVGAHYNLQLLSAITEKDNSQMFSEIQGCQATAGTGMAADVRNLLSIVPESTKEIETYMANFFESLPDSAVVCISFLGKSYVSLLDGLMHYSSCVYGLMLLSYLSADSQPVVILLPLTSLVEDVETMFCCSTVGETDVHKEWRSPWGSNALVDDVAPLFKAILRENYLSCSSFPEEDTETNRQMWWTQRFSLDDCLQNFVREMEESWFGQWKYLLLGRWLDAESLIPAMKELMQQIKDRFKICVNESVLKVAMGGIKSANLEKERIPKVFLEKGCYISSVKDCGERCSALNEESTEADYILGSIFAAVNRHEVEYCTRREPVVLVLDSNVQMLPWENMPIMREQEVYRVPSVASVSVALQRRCAVEEACRVPARFPLIDPLDAFYLLNPSGDLSCTQAEFEDWFRSLDIQGMSGVVPSTEDWTAALENHDLFLYFGHGSGAQYIPPEKVKKLENCAATLLMGCSSGTLILNGSYPPVGTPLAYILAGAPIVIANLWEVTDRDIDRFAKAMLKSFMEERSISSTSCIQCSLLAEEFESMNVNEKKGNPRKGREKKKLTKTIPDIAGGYCFKHKLRAGYFVSQARKACKLPYLIGAAPVCYGVPTGSRKKERCDEHSFCFFLENL